MNTILMGLLVAVTGLAAPPCLAGAAGGPGQPTLSYVTGSVLEIAVSTDEAGSKWTDAKIAADDGSSTWLRLAPPEILEREGFELHVGDVIHARAFAGREPLAIHRITNVSRERSLRLRCLHGDPLWDSPRGRYGRGGWRGGHGGPR